MVEAIGKYIALFAKEPSLHQTSKKLIVASMMGTYLFMTTLSTAIVT
jgi:hypothetical protein